MSREGSTGFRSSSNKPLSQVTEQLFDPAIFANFNRRRRRSHSRVRVHCHDCRRSHSRVRVHCHDSDEEDDDSPVHSRPGTPFMIDEPLNWNDSGYSSRRISPQETMKRINYEGIKYVEDSDTSERPDFEENLPIDGHLSSRAKEDVVHRISGMPSMVGNMKTYIEGSEV